MEKINNWCQSHNYWPRKIVFGLLVLLAIGWIFSGDEHRGNKNDQINTITVSGKGEVLVKPDIASVSFGVSAENMDVAKAQTESATKINAILAFLKTNGVEDKDVKTTNYSIYPRYDYVKSADIYYGGKQVLAGYTVSQTVTVKIRKIEDAGKILSGLGGLGATDVSGLSFLVDKEDELKVQARDKAIEDAKTQAKNLAKSLGVKIVKITSFSESGNYPIYYAKAGIGAADMTSSVAPQIPTGENTITSNVNITYEIR